MAMVVRSFRFVVATLPALRWQHTNPPIWWCSSSPQLNPNDLASFNQGTPHQHHHSQASQASALKGQPRMTFPGNNTPHPIRLVHILWMFPKYQPNRLKQISKTAIHPFSCFKRFVKSSGRTKLYIVYVYMLYLPLQDSTAT